MTPRTVYAAIVLLPLFAFTASAQQLNPRLAASNNMTLQEPITLTIQCQKGTVSFDMPIGETVYKDCSPDEGAKTLFDAFAHHIQLAQRAEKVRLEKCDGDQ